MDDAHCRTNNIAGYVSPRVAAIRAPQVRAAAVPPARLPSLPLLTVNYQLWTVNFISNRNTHGLEFPLTHRKQRTRTHSNRNKFRGVLHAVSPIRLSPAVTINYQLLTVNCISNR